MSHEIKIALSVPDEKKKHRYFSLGLQHAVRSLPVKYSMPSKLLAIGGFEGNFQLLIRSLISNKVIDKYLHWTFEEGHLVIMGNCLDREGSMVQCLWLAYALEGKARKAGGYVHFLPGLNEIMHLNSHWRHRHPSYAQSSRSPHTALYNGNQELWQWLRTKNLVEQIGDLLIIPSGISNTVLELNLPIGALNHQLRFSWQQATDQGSDQFLKDLQVRTDDHFPQTLGLEREIASLLDRYSINTILTSHPPTEQFHILFDNHVINIPGTQLSDRPATLLIKKNRYYKTSGYQRRERIK